MNCRQPSAAMVLCCFLAPFLFGAVLLSSSVCPFDEQIDQVLAAAAASSADVRYRRELLDFAVECLKQLEAKTEHDIQLMERELFGPTPPAVSGGTVSSK